MRLSRKAGAALLVVLVVSSLAVPAAAAALAPNWQSDVSPNVRDEVDFTKEVHDMSWDSPLAYEDNQGNIAELNGVLNQSADNPISFVATEINFSDANAFPHGKDVSALTASEWTTGTNVSASDVTTAPGVSALNLATDGTLGSGSSTTATFSNFSVTSDENKRYLQLVQNVNSIESGTEVQYRVVDEDGDYKRAVLNTSRTSGEDFVGNATGDGLIYQAQLGTLTTRGSGDGTFNNIQKVVVNVTDGDADLTITALNVEKMGEWKFGTKLANTDSDDELENSTHYEHKSGGALEVTSLSTLGTAFSDARLHDVTMQVWKRAEDLPNEDVKVVREKDSGNKYPGYYGTVTYYVRSNLKTAYDISYANPVMTDEQTVPSSRVLSVQYAEGTGDTDFSSIDSWSKKSSLYTGEGANVTLDSTIQPGQERVVKIKLKLTKSEYQNAAFEQGGAGGPMGSGSGPNWLGYGFFGSILASIGAIFKRVKG